MQRIALIAAASAAALAACSDAGQSADSGEAPTQTAAIAVPEDPPAPDAQEPDAPAENPDELLTGGAQAVADAETMGGDGSPLVLSSLEAGDADGLEGELACSFTPDGAPGPILAGRANVGADRRSHAVVRNAGYAEMLTSQSAGGFAAMEGGTTYGGRGLTVTIDPTSGDMAEHEGSVKQATLLAQRGDGAERSWDGTWSCGP